MSFLASLLFGLLVISLTNASALQPQSKDGSVYSFGYHVLDPSVGQDFGHSEQGLKDSVKGEYSVLLPNDKIQVVKYTADQNGYVASVEYVDGSQSPAYGKQKSNQPAITTSYFNPPTGGQGSYSQYGTPAGAHNRNGYGAHPSNHASHGGSFLTKYGGIQSRMGEYVPGVGCTCP